MIETSVKAAPEEQEPPTREEEVEDEKMQANPAYLPIEMTSHESQGQQYMNVELAPPDVADTEERTKLQANPAYLPIEMMSYKSQESKYINIPSWSNRGIVLIHGWQVVYAVRWYLAS